MKKGSWKLYRILCNCAQVPSLYTYNDLMIQPAGVAAFYRYSIWWWYFVYVNPSVIVTLCDRCDKREREYIAIHFRCIPFIYPFWLRKKSLSVPIQIWNNVVNFIITVIYASVEPFNSYPLRLNDVNEEEFLLWYIHVHRALLTHFQPVKLTSVQHHDYLSLLTCSHKSQHSQQQQKC